MEEQLMLEELIFRVLFRESKVFRSIKTEWFQSEFSHQFRILQQLSCILWQVRHSYQSQSKYNKSIILMLSYITSQQIQCMIIFGSLGQPTIQNTFCLLNFEQLIKQFVCNCICSMQAKNYTSNSSFMKGAETDSQHSKTLNQIRQSLFTRTMIYEQIIVNQNMDKYLQANDKYKIVAHCNQYSKIANFVTNLISNSRQNGHMNDQEKFWQINENLERQLESFLRQLKNIDNIIDNIVNQEFDKCNQIDEIQENIRIILSRKQPNHISKAEPLNQQREQSLLYLSEKKRQKQEIKQEKLKMIKKILSLLDQLRRHRETGLKMSLIEEKDKKNTQNEQILIERVASDLKQIIRNEIELSNMQEDMSDLTKFISQSQKKIQKCSNELLDLLEQQNSAYSQFQSLAKLKIETEHFESSILGMFGASNIKKKGKKDFTLELQNIILKIEKHIKDNREKDKQIAKIEQGIQTTKKTISIFEHIISKVQTENIRKRKLLKDLEKIQNKHKEQDERLYLIAENENEVEKLKLRKNQLNKNLDSKMNEANLSAYKTIHEEIVRLDNEIKNKMKVVQQNRQHVSDAARQLYQQTTQLQHQYEDILSEIVPSIWLKGSDFTKEESIRDLNLYLLKTFKRLSIAD